MPLKTSRRAVARTCSASVVALSAQFLLPTFASAQTPIAAAGAPKPEDLETSVQSRAEVTPPAQTAGDAAAPTASPDEPGEILVTGSRIKAGFQTPTPVTVVTADALKAVAPNNLADGLNQLPVFNGSLKTTQGGQPNQTLGVVGQNLLNLRGLGAPRNLVLLDGRRLVATNQQGSVDINVIPQNLVSRVEVVTGGASAAYGSDAIAGVVNFVLDTKFEGLKGEVQGGISSRGDLASRQASLAFGHSYGGGRGHFIFSAQYARADGVGVNGDTHRQWWERGSGQIQNPVAGAAPTTLVIPDIRASTASFGGLITSGPLKGTQFLPGGIPAPFNYGSIVGTTFMSGGDGPRPQTGFSPDSLRTSLFARSEYEVSDALTLIAEAMYGHSHTVIDGSLNQHVGAAAQFIIFRDNAYLPAATRALMVTNNLNTINVGRYFGDTPPSVADSETKVRRGVLGVKGNLSDRWSYDASYTYGQTKQSLFQRGRTNLRNLYAAADSVVSPTTGQIVCRSTLSGFDPGCVPINIFGAGSVTPAAAAYTTGDTGKDLTLTQNVAVFNITGDLGNKLQLGAGPISVASGIEYRKESASQTSDALSQAFLNYNGIRGFPPSTNNRIGVYQSYNPQPFKGQFDIKEAYAEVGLPVFKDRRFAQALEINGAVRRADYSRAGPVTTWKYGASWLIVDDVRLRYTKSRDIRGPNIIELFNAQSQLTANFVYNGVTTSTTTINSGNPDLKPERALTETYGIVLRPSFIPGLQASVDRYSITIDGAINTLGGQRTIDLCASGVQFACAAISVSGTNPTTLAIRATTLNLNQIKTVGYDIEVAYQRQAFGGDLQLRLLASHTSENSLLAAGDAKPLSLLGTPDNPYWRATSSIRYNQESWGFYFQERFISASVIDPQGIEGVTTNLNRIPPIFYTDIGVQYRVKVLGREQELFFSVANLLNQDPPISGGNPSSFSVPASTAYDWSGRYYTAGIRFKF